MLVLQRGHQRSLGLFSHLAQGRLIRNGYLHQFKRKRCLRVRQFKSKSYQRLRHSNENQGHLAIVSNKLEHVSFHILLFLVFQGLKHLFHLSVAKATSHVGCIVEPTQKTVYLWILGLPEVSDVPKYNG